MTDFYSIKYQNSFKKLFLKNNYQTGPQFLKYFINSLNMILRLLKLEFHENINLSIF